MKIRKAPPTIWKNEIGNNLFGSQAASASRETKNKNQPKEPENDNLFYKLPETSPPQLQLGVPLLNTLGIEAQSPFDKNTLTKKKEEDEVLKDFLREYDIENIKNTTHEQAKIPENIFFYGGDSDEFEKAIEFINASPINREFG